MWLILTLNSGIKARYYFGGGGVIYYLSPTRGQTELYDSNGVIGCVTETAEQIDTMLGLNTTTSDW